MIYNWKPMQLLSSGSDGEKRGGLSVMHLNNLPTNSLVRQTVL